MRNLFALCCLLFLGSLFFRGVAAAQSPAFRPDLLDHLVGVSELQVVSLRQEIVSTQKSILECPDWAAKRRLQKELMMSLQSKLSKEQIGKPEGIPQ